MKISQLIKELNAIKRKNGDLNVRFDASSVTEDDFDPEACVVPLAVNGVFKVRYEDRTNARKEVLLINKNNESEAFSADERL